MFVNTWIQKYRYEGVSDVSILLPYFSPIFYIGYYAKSSTYKNDPQYSI